MGKELRLLTEKDLEGKCMPQDLFHCLVMVAQVAKEIDTAEESQEKKQRCDNDLQCATTQLSSQDDYLNKQQVSRTAEGSRSSQNFNTINAPAQRQDLKPEFLNRIQNMRGTDIKLIIEKDLFKSDLKKRANRFSIPLNQVEKDARDFLTDEEKNTLEKRTKNNRLFTLEVPLIEPNLQTTTVIKLRKWQMNNVYSYLLSGKWNEIRLRNELETGNTMQVWSFRVQERLHLALVNLSKDYQHDN